LSLSMPSAGSPTEDQMLMFSRAPPKSGDHGSCVVCALSALRGMA
jgi:hypothetical protein